MNEPSVARPSAHLAAALIGAVVWIVAGAQIAVLCRILFTAILHPLQYFLLQWSGEVSLLFSAGVGAGLAVVLLGGAAWAAPAGRRARVAELGRAAWPALLVVSWCGALWTERDLPREVGGLIVLASILPAGWAIGRVAASWVRPQPLEVMIAPWCWWREVGWWCLVAAVVGLSVLHAWVQVRLFDMWVYGSPDIGYYAEMLLNVIRGRGLYCEAFGHHFFGEHFSPGLYLLVPFYACYPHVQTLMIIGAAAPTAGALAVYALGRGRGVGQMGATLLGTAFLMFPSTSRVIYGGSYGFHEILVAIPLMLWSFYFLDRRRWVIGALFVVLAVSFKENVAVVYAAYGLCIALFGRRWWGAALAGVSIAYFCAVMWWIVPAYNTSGAYSKLYLFDQLGSGPLEIIKALVTDPGLLAGRLLRWRILGFALILLVPVAGLAVRRSVVLAALPTLLFICLMNTLDFASVRFWHQSSILAVVWLATVQAAAVGEARARRARIVAIFACCMLAHYALGMSPTSRLWRELSMDAGQRPAALADLQRLIPISDTVQASPRLAAHFIDYERVYPLHIHPDPLPQWILFDRADTFAGESAIRDMHAYMRTVIEQRLYVPIADDSGIIVLRRVDESPAGP